MIFNTRIHGISCQCDVLEYIPARPMVITGSGFGDADPPEPAVFEFEIVDYNGNHIHWLDKYLTPEVEEQLLEEYKVHLFVERQERAYYYE